MDKHVFKPIKSEPTLCAFIDNNSVCSLPASDDIHNVSRPKTCSDCGMNRYHNFGDGSFGPMVELCPRHASVDDLYAAAKAALASMRKVRDERTQYEPDIQWVDAWDALRAAINKYEGRE